MDVVVTIQHPAHVHFFRNAIAELEDAGHDVHVFAREKDIALELLERYGIDHEVLAGEAGGLAGKALVQLRYEAALLWRARRIDPDVMVAIGEPGVVHVSRVLGCRSVVFTDTEHATWRRRLVYPFADLVCSPAAYLDDLGANHVRYPGYHELAYLHPNRFTPDPGIREEAGIPTDEPLVVMRLVSWQAAHDVGQGGIDDPFDAVSRLEAAGARVLISSEAPLPDGLADRRPPIASERIHHLLAAADLFVGESATMATESAVLGTPAVCISSIDDVGNLRELSAYGLVFSFAGERRHDEGLEKAVSIMDGGVDRDEWERRRRRLLADKTDTTRFVLTAVTASDDRAVRSVAARSTSPVD